MRIRISPALLLIFILALSAGDLCHADRYDLIKSRVENLHGSSFAKPIHIGTSGHGRPIYAIVLGSVSDLDSIPSDRARMLVISGQHGNESSAVMSMMDFAEGLSETQNPRYREILNKVLLVIVPVVNPDGYAVSRRYNANGVDLNRNWSNPNQAETLAITRFADTFRPHVMIDQHEWLDHAPRSYGLEIAGFGNGSQYKLQRLLTRSAIANVSVPGAKLDVIHYHSETNSNLAHRHFTEHGVCTFLLETSPGWSPQVRHRVYQKLTMGMMSDLAFPPNKTIAQVVSNTINSRMAASPIPADYRPVIEPSKTAGMPIEALFGLIIFLVAGYVIVRCMDGKQTQETLLRQGYGEQAIAYLHGQPSRLTISDALKLSISPRMKVAVIRQHRMRPSDRVPRKRLIDDFKPPKPVATRVPISPNRLRGVALYR